MELKKQSYTNGRWAVVVTIPQGAALTLRVRTEQSADTVIRTLSEHVTEAEATDVRIGRTLSGISPRAK